MNLTNRRIDSRSLRLLLVLLGALLWLWFAFGGSADSSNIFQTAKNTKTALALTADALLGPFPTSTVPTATASDLPTLTPTIPTATPSRTITPSPTPTFPVTNTPRTRQPGEVTDTLTATPPASRPTATRFVPTNTAVVPTNTSVPPTDPPPPPTISVPTIAIPTIPLIQTLFP